MAIAFAIRNLPSPDPTGIRDNPEPRGGNLIAVHTRLRSTKIYRARSAANLNILTGVHLTSCNRTSPGSALSAARRRSHRAQSNKLNHKRRFSDDGLTGN